MFAENIIHKLPNELLLLIAWELDETDLNSLAQASRLLYDLLNPVLYRHNVQYSESSAL